MEIICFEKLPQHILNGVQEIHQSVFEGSMLKQNKLENLLKFCAFIAEIEGVVVGFKLGYEMEDGVFYSWLGGVHPQYQKRGIASALMEAQHDWCKEQGYEKVRTYSRNERKAMLLLNLKHSFDVVSTFFDDKGRHKIVLEKRLTI